MSSDAAFDPENRELYTALFRSPEGYAFDRAAATTYSLDFETALAVLMAIAADDTVERAQALAQPLSLLRAVQRLSERITIYCDRGRILRAPARIAPLMALCERMIVEVAAPGGGAFHPKIWCVRFAAVEGHGGPDRLRFAILSRNLTPDRSWDLSLMLDGEVGGKDEPGNAPLVALMGALSSMAIDGDVKDTCIDPSFVRSLSRCRWEVPLGARKLSFAVNGVSGAGAAFTVPKGERLAVLSPFISARGLAKLRKGAGEDARCRLVARAVELDALYADALAPFERVQVLDDAISDVDPDACNDDTGVQGGGSLHAKAMLVETGGRVAISVGSANATASALLPNAEGITPNVEVMATLSGTIHKMGGIDDILFCEPFLAMLSDYTAPTEAVDEDERMAAESLLDEVRRDIAVLRYDLHCTQDDGIVSLMLHLAEGQGKLVLPDGVKCFVQMLAARNIIGLDASPLLAGVPMLLGAIALSDLTRWIGMRLRHEATGAECTFTLGATLIDPPGGREMAALRAIIEAHDFLAYIALLLGESDEGGAWEPSPEGADGHGARMIFEENDAVLEPLVRALCRDGDELGEIARLLEALRDPETGKSAAPDDFLDLWQAFTPLARKGRR